LRRFKRHEEFKILVGWLATGSLDDLLQRLTMLADYCVSRSAEWLVPAPIDSTHASWAIVALGKLGGMELGVHADLDLVIVYDDPRDPQDVALRWQQFVERLQRFLGETSGEETAYRIDTRLRPEGTKGALAIPVSGLERYFETRAEPWERLAWTRAQVVAGSPLLSRSIARTAEAFVYASWDRALPRVMSSIRARMERTVEERRGATRDFKVGRGGLSDIDFVAELVQIREGRTRHEFRTPGTRRFFEARSPTRYIKPAEYAELHESYRFLRTVEVLARMDEDIGTNVIKDDGVALESLGRRMGLAEPSGSLLLKRYRETTARVRSLYTTVLDRL
jgi:glutamate-ammonia-ligase adenylyltransferase